MSGMGKSRKSWAVLNTVTKKRITYKMLLRGAINFPRCRNSNKTPCITECVKLQLSSPLVTKSFACYRNNLGYGLLSLNTTRSLIDFIFFRRQYP